MSLAAEALTADIAHVRTMLLAELDDLDRCSARLRAELDCPSGPATRAVNTAAFEATNRAAALAALTQAASYVGQDGAS
jgi:hypothetical protein